jgi:hypothetical protein
MHVPLCQAESLQYTEHEILEPENNANVRQATSWAARVGEVFTQRLHMTIISCGISCA